ncbi:MAG: hypothetical protein JSW31_09930 [Burkholderiales bacterium]|nr:MAG: hypothetical protein JSW31_09930 [Burkholderiales bacterium]
MRLKRIRWLIVFIVAMFTVNGVAAAARACTLSQVRHEHSTLQWQQAKVDATCPEAAATPCVSHCVQEAKSGEQKAPVDSPPAVIAPPLALTQATFPPVQSPLHVASSDLIVGPSLTILFGNLRN